MKIIKLFLTISSLLTLTSYSMQVEKLQENIDNLRKMTDILSLKVGPQFVKNFLDEESLCAQFVAACTLRSASVANSQDHSFAKMVYEQQLQEIKKQHPEECLNNCETQCNNFYYAYLAVKETDNKAAQKIVSEQCEEFIKRYKLANFVLKQVDNNPDNTVINAHLKKLTQNANDSIIKTSPFEWEDKN